MDFSAQLYLCTLGKFKKKKTETVTKNTTVWFSSITAASNGKLHLDRIISAGLLWLKQHLHDDYQSSSLWHYVHCKLADHKVSWVKSSQRLLHHPKWQHFAVQHNSIYVSIYINSVLSSKSASANLKLNNCHFDRLHLNPWKGRWESVHLRRWVTLARATANACTAEKGYWKSRM